MRRPAWQSRLGAAIVTLALATGFALTTGLAPAPGPLAAIAPPAARANTPVPTTVTLAGDLQSELGCAADWDPACAATHLSYDAGDDAWQATFTVPAGTWQYKVALNGTWDENYGAHAALNGDNIALTLAAPTAVTFIYSHATHWIADSVTSVIATAPGSFQSELGCPGDWQPDCLRSWLQDPDGDGIYTFETTALPVGTYEGKVALNQGWDVNYGQGGVPGGPNIPFSVTVQGQKVSFRYDASSHVLTILAGHAADGNVEWDGLRHDSRDDLYRTPGGAVPAGTPVTLRFRTFHDDVTSVKVRLYSVEQNGQQILPMTRAASGVGCYQAGLEQEACDFWQATLPGSWGADNLWYRFIVSDGADTDYYADNTPALDGGLGAPTDEPVDQSWALMLHVPGFTSPTWARNAVVYQIFPDRFRNGRTSNDPRTGDVRYDVPVLKLPWGTKPEGYCRNYEDGDVNCPWRFEANPPASSPTTEQPQGRDYMGGDLRGVDSELAMLKSLGITTIYFNPVFNSGSDHGYDTQDYTKIDPYFGSQGDWQALVSHADGLGIRIILDGVFNHMSSDSPFFDRYGHYATVGACESVSSTYRAWFTFTPQANGPCAGPNGPHTMTYAGWFGFDSIPVITKSLPAVQSYFLTGRHAIATSWLRAGASGWRLDVAGDSSFPAGYWETFRRVTKAASPSSLSVSETWQKDSTLLRMLRGDRTDTTMDYRLRDAVLGLLAPQPFDSKGFADSGRQLTVGEFASRLASIREDYPDAAYFSLMNLLDSHDTERLLWTLTPGSATTAGKESPAALAAGKVRVRLASLVQFTLAGMPTVYYGDEVGMTGADDPDDRRTYPWPGTPGAAPDGSLFASYASLARERAANPALTDGDLRILLADDATATVAYGRRTTSRAAIVALNVGSATRTVAIPVAGYLPDGTVLSVRYSVGAQAAHQVTVTGGSASIDLPALGGAYLSSGRIDLAPPAAPRNLRLVTEGNGSLAIAWQAVRGAAGYNVYTSPVTGGGYTKVTETPITATSFTIAGLVNARRTYVVVRAVDGVGNKSGPSGEVLGIPHPAIGWSNLKWPPTITHTISAVNRTPSIYGQIWIDGVTNLPGAAPGLIAQLGFGPDGTDPATNGAWSWTDASFNTDAGNNNEYVASLLPDATGLFDYAYRYSVTAGRDWVYADLDGSSNGYSPAQAGALTVVASGDTTAPATPTGLAVTTASPAGVGLAWDAVAGDASLYGYEVGRRAGGSSGAFATIALVTGSAAYTDVSVVEGVSYDYVVRSVDLSFNRSADSAPVTATAELRTVTLTFNVTVPATTDGTGRQVNIAGFLDRLDGGHPQWNAGATPMTRVDATHWTITFTGKESIQLEYKYALEDFDHVEKDAACAEIANRLLTLSFGANGTQVVDDTVPNWRNVAPCGN